MSTPARNLGTRIYLLVVAAALVLSFAAIWIYVIRMPMHFLETGYVSWTAKIDLIKACDLGDLVIIGDSQAEGAIDPRGMSVKATNLAVGGATPIEMYYWVERVLRCPKLPRHVVLSAARGQMGVISKFLFENGARYGYIGFDSLQEIQTRARQLNDKTLDELRTRDGLSGTARNAFYALHAPPLYFSSLVTARFNGRFQSNTETYRRLLQNRGHNEYNGHVQAAADGEAPESRTFSVVPIQDDYMNRLVDRLAQAGVQVHFFAMPRRQSPDEQTAREQDRLFDNYLAAQRSAHPKFDVIGGLPAVWPDELFADAAHLNPDGTRHYTELFNRCVNARLFAQEATAADDACDFTAAMQLARR